MEVTIKVRLQPFRVPNYVLVVEGPSNKEDGFKEGRKYDLNELDESSLLELCDEFKTAVFKKAGKDMPPTAA